MSDAIEIDYAPTGRELAFARAQAGKALPGARGRTLRKIWLGLTAIVAATMTGRMAASAQIEAARRGEPWLDPEATALLVLVFASAAWVMFGMVRRERDALAARIPADSRLRFDASEVTRTSARSRSFHDWRDTSAMVERPQVAAMLAGEEALALPNRLLFPAGSPGALRARIKTWHAEATA
ncbi:hypothetical protein ACQ5SO_13555 [Rhodovulum sp. DZ06]|uniref:hypothetical protein n=1 Tax=Rhodovulum sp. DZ06 TaxID=3425126 RepID=UPI003D358FAF